MIYIFALGGKVLRPKLKPTSVTKRGFVVKRDSVVMHSFSDIGLNLLTVCREIYANTVWLSWAYNTINFNNLHTIKRIMCNLRPYQRKAITHIAFIAEPYAGLEPKYNSFCGYNDQGRSLAEELPNLRQIHVCILNPGYGRSIIVDAKNTVTQQLRKACRIKGCNYTCGLKFEVVDTNKSDAQNQ